MSTQTALLAAVATLAASPALAEELSVEIVTPEASLSESLAEVAVAVVATPVAAVAPLTSWWQTQPAPEPQIDTVQEIEVDLEVHTLDHCPPCGKG